MWFFRKRKPKLTAAFLRETFKDAIACGDKVYVSQSVIDDLKDVWDIDAKVFAEAGIIVAEPGNIDEDTHLVCARALPGEPLFFDDNLIADCDFGCGFKIQYRPHNPKTRTRVCTECMLARLKSKAESS